MLKRKRQGLALPKFRVNNNKNLRLLYGVGVTRDLLNRFTLFFLPIFLFELGSNTSILDFVSISAFQRGILTIGIYFIVNTFVTMITNISFGNIVAKLGFQKSFIFSNILFLIHFVGLYYVTSYPILSLLLLASVIRGCSSSFFWGSYFTILSKNAKPRSMGQDVGLLRMLLQLVAVVSPAVSGFIAYLAGMEVLFLIGILISLIGVIIILFMEEERINYSLSWKEFLAWLQERRYGRLAVSIMGKHVYDTAVFIWPLYVFMLLGSIERVGYLYTVSLFLALLITFFTGVYLDNSKNRRPFYLSGGVLSAVWIARTQIMGVWGIVFSDVFDRLAAAVHGLFFDAAMIKRGKGSKAFAYFMYREVLVNFIALVFWLLLSTFFLIFNGGWTALFILASVGVMASLLVRDSKELKV